LSFLFPGLGQFYNGHSKKGIILVVGAIVSVILYVILIGAILYLLIWIYGLYDAYKSAEAINNGVNVPDEISLNF
jgi:TM2 domain-containing membrane protein YozV